MRDIMAGKDILNKIAADIETCLNKVIVPPTKVYVYLSKRTIHKITADKLDPTKEAANSFTYSTTTGTLLEFVPCEYIRDNDYDFSYFD